MVVYCPQSYEIHRCHRDLTNVYMLAFGSENANKKKPAIDARRVQILTEL